MTRTARPYQLQARRDAYKAWRNGAKNIILVMATGTGKTHTATMIVGDVYEKSNRRTLFVAHRAELIDQAFNAFRAAGLRPSVEMAGETHFGKDHNPNVVVASVQSIAQKKRLALFNPDDYALVIIDEAHHAVSPTYRRVLEHFANTRTLGLTATAFRHDRIGLKNVFDAVAFQYPIQQGIEDGYLCPIVSKSVEVESLHLERVRVVKGEFDDAEIHALLLEEETLQQMVLPTIELAESRPTIIFCENVEHATAITACFNRALDTSSKDGAVLVHGGLSRDERRTAFHRFETGQAQFLVNVGIAVEGYDHPPTACVAIFRPMKSLGQLTQIVGRGTRIAPGKENCLILDFTNIGDTVQTVNVLDVLDGTVIDAKTKKRAKEYAAKGKDAVAALRDAKYDIANLAKIAARMKAVYRATGTNLMDVLGVSRAQGLFGGEGVTPKQAALLQKFGVEPETGFQKGEAMRLIDALIKRREAGLCTVRQAKMLSQHGVAHAWDISFEDAKVRIGAITK